MSSGDLKGAEENLREALKKMPKNAYARNMLGMIQARNGDLDAAEASFKKATESRPGYVEPYLNLAYIAEQRGDMQTALRHYKTATTKNPYSVKAMIAMGKIYAANGRLFDAESCYRKASRLNPFSSDLHKALGLVYAQGKKYPEAVGEFEKATSINPQDGEAWYAIGLIYNSAGDAGSKETARQAFEKCAATNTSYAALARQKLGGEAPAAASAPGRYEPTQPDRGITAESPEGDITLTITKEWTEIPANGEGDRYLWLMSYLQKGILFTVYKPISTPSKGAGAAEAEAKARTAGMKGVKKSSATINGHEFTVYEAKTESNKTRRILATQLNGKVYMFEAEYPKLEDSAEIDRIMGSAELRQVK